MKVFFINEQELISNILLFSDRLWLTKHDYLETGATLNVQEGQVYEENEPQ